MEISDINNENYESYRSEAVLLQRDGDRDKVYLYKNTHAIKIFVHKKIFSSSRLVNKAKQFERNSHKLESLGIPAVTVEKVFYLQNPQRQCVVYRFIKGDTFYAIYQKSSNELREELMSKFISFYKILHSKGVYFRSVHLDNVVVKEDGSLCLIDIGDIQFKGRSLNTIEVFRNFKAILRRKQDFKIFEKFGMNRVLSMYFKVNQVPRLFVFLTHTFKNHPIHKLLNS